MKTPARVLRHPVHPMLIVFPMGLWVFSFVCDIASDAGRAESWRLAALYSMGGGIIGALLAAFPGLADLFSLPESRARTIGFWHLTLNLLVTLAFVVDFFMRTADRQLFWGPFFVSLGAIAVLGLSAWLDGSMVYVHGVGVSASPEGKPTAASE